MKICIEGVGLWSSQLADFAALRSLLAGSPPEPPPARPAAAMLPPNERRRAPESVLLAIEVAGQAVAMSGHSASELACVFASAHGDQPITDYMCATLAQAPAELSPIRFHNSVHNAPVGYWTIATGCHAPSTAVAAQRDSFGAGLLEAASQVLAEQRPVLLVCSDIRGSGPLLEATGCTQPFGCALVLARRPADDDGERDLSVTTSQPSLCAAPLDAWRDSESAGRGIAVAGTLAPAGGHGRCQLDTAATLGLLIDMESIA